MAVAKTLDQLLSADEVLVVIDHNAALMKRATDSFVGPAGDTPNQPQIRVLANANERGLSGARNTGVAAAHGDLIVFLDDDAQPHTDWLAQLTSAFRDSSVIGTGGVALPSWEAEPPKWLPTEFLWVVGCSYKGLPERSVEIRNPIGANMAFRRDVILRAGGFTDGIGRVGRTPLGCEETEFSIRATETTRGRIIQQPAAIVSHLVPAERMRLGYFVRRCWAEGISKAIVSRLTGRSSALESERRYTTRTLPLGVIRAVGDGIRGDASGVARAAAIITGLLVTTAGYLRGGMGKLKPAATDGTYRTRSDTPQEFVPIWSGELDLAAPTLPDHLEGADGQAFDRARLLVRASGTPLGFVELDAPQGEVDLDRAVALAQSRFADQAARAGADLVWKSAAGPKVSIVLCTYNRALGARRTLASFRELRYEDLEIIVVDNAPSDDATLSVVNEFAAADPRVRYIREPRKGLSRARNRGLQEATGEFVAFTDDDVRVDPFWIHGLLRGFGRRADVACVTGLVASASLARPAEQFFDRRAGWASTCTQRLYTLARGPLDSPMHPYTAGVYGAGANFAAKLSVLRSLGGFDECLGAGSLTRGGEDLDIFVRMLLSGHALSYEPSALAWHDHRVDEASLSTQMYAYGLGLTAYVTKHILSRRSRRAMIGRAVGGSRHVLRLIQGSRRATADASIQNDLAGVELRGMLAGPIAYLRARRGQDKQQRKAVAP